MLAGENIICLGTDWDEDGNGGDGQRAMRLLARRNRVLWLSCLEDPAALARTGSGPDRRRLGRMVRKARDLARGPVRVADSLWVHTPALVPMPPPPSPSSSGFSRKLFEATLAMLRRRLGMATYHLWSFLPMALPYLGLPDERLLVYYCAADWSQLWRASGVAASERERIERMEQETCRRADLVFTEDQALWSRRRAFNPETHLVRRAENGSGVDRDESRVEELERHVRAVLRRRTGKHQQSPSVVEAAPPPSPIGAPARDRFSPPL